MLNSALIEILRTFDKHDLKKFEDFIQSPYFNKNSTVIKLFKHFKKYSPGLENENLKREIVWESLYPGKDFNYGVMKNLVYKLTQLAEKFLVEEAFAKDEFRKGFFLIDRLDIKGLNKQFSLKYKAFEGSLIIARGSEMYKKLSELKWLKYSVAGESNVSETNLVYELSEFTIYSTLIDLFKLYNNLIADRISVNIYNPYNLLEEFLSKIDLTFVLQYIKENSPGPFKIINIYYRMYLALSNTGSSESFYDFKNTFLENDHLISKSEQKDLLSCLWTSLSGNTNIKNKSFEFHEINKTILQKNLLLNEEGFISARSFSLSIRLAAMVKDRVFIENFIKTYLDKLIPSAKENMVHYSSAYLHFVKSEYSKALSFVNKINFDMFSFKFELKYLQIMLFYELNEYDSLTYAFDSYRHFAANNPNLSSVPRENMFKFINFVNALYKQKEVRDNIKLELMRENVLRESMNTKNWLLEKIEELEFKK